MSVHRQLGPLFMMTGREVNNTNMNGLLLHHFRRNTNDSEDNFIPIVRHVGALDAVEKKILKVNSTKMRNRTKCLLYTYSDTWTKMSSPPSFGVMNPCPFCRQNVRIVPRTCGSCSMRSRLEKSKKLNK